MAFFKFVTEEYKSKSDMWNVIHYCQRQAKFVYSPNMLTYSLQIIYDQFGYYKKFYFKEEGNQLIHCVLSFDSSHWERWVLWQTVELCAMRICALFEGYQTVAFGHPKKGQLHVHFLINTVSFATGKRFHINREEFRDFMKEAAFWLSLEHIALLSVSYFNEEGKFQLGSHDEDSLYLDSPLNNQIIGF